MGVSDYNNNLMHGASDFSSRVREMFASNPRLVEWAIKHYNIVHNGGIKSIHANKLTSRDLITLSWIEDRVKTGSNLTKASSLYKVAMAAGPMKFYPSAQSYLTACSVKLCRRLSTREEKFLLWKSRIASLAIGG